MLEIGASMESKEKSVEATEDIDFDICDISFEELLAQEKKDSFWLVRNLLYLDPVNWHLDLVLYTLISCAGRRRGSPKRGRDDEGWQIEL